ncbi:MAG: pilin [bacterium]|nr:pilin [bacterium]
MKIKKILIVIILMSAALAFSAKPIPGLAAPTAPTDEPPKIEDFNKFIQSNDDSGPAFNFLVAVGYALAIIGIVYAGVLYLSAFGSEERPGLAKKAIIAVITGLVIIVLARVIVNSIVPPNQNNSIVNTGLTK